MLPTRRHLAVEEAPPARPRSTESIVATCTGSWFISVKIRSPPEKVSNDWLAARRRSAGTFWASARRRRCHSRRSRAAIRSSAPRAPSRRSGAGQSKALLNVRAVCGTRKFRLGSEEQTQLAGVDEGNAERAGVGDGEERKAQQGTQRLRQAHSAPPGIAARKGNGDRTQEKAADPCRRRLTGRFSAYYCGGALGLQFGLRRPIGLLLGHPIGRAALDIRSACCWDIRSACCWDDPGPPGLPWDIRIGLLLGLIRSACSCWDIHRPWSAWDIRLAWAAGTSGPPAALAQDICIPPAAGTADLLAAGTADLLAGLGQPKSACCWEDPPSALQWGGAPAAPISRPERATRFGHGAGLRRLPAPRGVPELHLFAAHSLGCAIETLCRDD